MNSTQWKPQTQPVKINTFCQLHFSFHDKHPRAKKLSHNWRHFEMWCRGGLNEEFVEDTVCQTDTNGTWWLWQWVPSVYWCLTVLATCSLYYITLYRCLTVLATCSLYYITLYRCPTVLASHYRPRTSHRTVRNVSQFTALLLHSPCPVRHLVPPTFTVHAKMKVIQQKMNKLYTAARYTYWTNSSLKHTGCFKTMLRFPKNNKVGLQTPLEDFHIPSFLPASSFTLSCLPIRSYVIRLLLFFLPNIIIICYFPSFLTAYPGLRFIPSLLSLSFLRQMLIFFIHPLYLLLTFSCYFSVSLNHNHPHLTHNSKQYRTMKCWLVFSYASPCSKQKFVQKQAPSVITCSVV
jgi:hypothetical protein